MLHCIQPTKPNTADTYAIHHAPHVHDTLPGREQCPIDTLMSDVAAVFALLALPHSRDRLACGSYCSVLPTSRGPSLCSTVALVSSAMVDDDVRLDSVFLRQLIPRISDDVVEQSISKLTAACDYSLRQLHGMYLSELTCFGLGGEVARALHSRGTQQRANISSAKHSCAHRPYPTSIHPSIGELPIHSPG